MWKGYLIHYYLLTFFPVTLELVFPDWFIQIFFRAVIGLILPIYHFCMPDWKYVLHVYRFNDRNFKKDQMVIYLFVKCQKEKKSFVTDSHYYGCIVNIKFPYCLLVHDFLYLLTYETYNS